MHCSQIRKVNGRHTSARSVPTLIEIKAGHVTVWRQCHDKQTSIAMIEKRENTAAATAQLDRAWVLRPLSLAVLLLLVLLGSAVHTRAELSPAAVDHPIAVTVNWSVSVDWTMIFSASDGFCQTHGKTSLPSRGADCCHGAACHAPAADLASSLGELDPPFKNVHVLPPAQGTGTGSAPGETFRPPIS
jgi:hypothetical protein